MDDISQRLRALKKSWCNIKDAQHDLTYLGLPGKDRQYIEDAIDGLVQMAEQLESSHEDIQLMVRRSLEAQLGHAEAYFIAKKTTENPSMRMLSFAAILQQMQKVLKSATAQSSSNPDSRSSAKTA